MTKTDENLSQKERESVSLLSLPPLSFSYQMNCLLPLPRRRGGRGHGRRRRRKRKRRRRRSCRGFRAERRGSEAGSGGPGPARAQRPVPPPPRAAAARGTVEAAPGPPARDAPQESVSDAQGRRGRRRRERAQRGLRLLQRDPAVALQVPARADRQRVVRGGAGHRIDRGPRAEEHLHAEAVRGRDGHARALVHADDDVGHVVELRGAFSQAGCFFSPQCWPREEGERGRKKSEFSSFDVVVFFDLLSLPLSPSSPPPKKNSQIGNKRLTDRLRG